jgi:hypothetical protein
MALSLEVAASTAKEKMQPEVREHDMTLRPIKSGMSLTPISTPHAVITTFSVPL